MLVRSRLTSADDKKGKDAFMADFTNKTTKNTTNSKKSRCPVSKKCGGCTMIDVPYAEQAERKQQLVEELIGEFGRVDPIIRADRIIQTVFALMESFKIRVYDEDRGTGFLRYVQVRTARGTRQVMVTLVTAEAVFPPAKKFVNALIKRHPEITTVVQNINDKHTTMVLGDREKVLFGPGYIEDVLCKKRFRISSRSFYQVNSLQTEKLYNIALDYAGFSGKERILDAYCGIGTIGIIASDRCKEVLSVELNVEAVKDAKINAKLNGADNVEVYKNDAGRFMEDMAARKEKLDILYFDRGRIRDEEGGAGRYVPLYGGGRDGSIAFT